VPRTVTPTNTVAIIASVLVLLGVPALVVLLASDDTAGGGTTPSAQGVPASKDPHKPAAPFVAGAGDGVRPDGIGCTIAPGTAVVGRAHLDLFVDGARVTVPAKIGVRPTCAYWLRTLDDDGVVTIASPQRRSFTVGDLFDIWGAPLSSQRFLGFAIGPERPLRAFVDGRRASGSVRAIALRDGREIALVAGRRPARIPSGFDAGSG
jgi:hypothetical protein